MPTKRMKLSDQLRKAVLASDKTRYQLWKETGIDQATLSKLVKGKAGLSTDAWDRLAEALGLDLVSREQRATRKGK